MFTLRRCLSCALLLPLAILAGCSLFSGDAGTPERHDVQGGFTVRVDGRGLPSAASVVADIGAFAQRRGFVRQSGRTAPPVDPVTHQPLPAAPDRYTLENLVLEVSRQPAEQRISAYLHGSSSKDSRRFIDRFYLDFAREYAGRYGGADRISQSAYADDAGSSAGPAGTLGPGGTPDPDSPLRTGVPAASGAPSVSGDPAGRL